MADGPSRVTHHLADFTGAGYDKGRSKLWQASWFATERLLFRAWWFPMAWKPAILRAFGARIGTGVHIRHTVRVLWPWKLEIDDHAWVGEGAWLLNLENIRIGANACVSQEAFLCTGSHDHLSSTFEFDNGPITIEDSAWVAAQAMVLRGVTVGQGALVGARAVVTRSVPAGTRVPTGSTY
ncbi:putative colanic acid biosynthesis acetyltransferase [uncultured Jatrophihabitans sp.]|uniref:putative colanic acid biosynthesis acetyltransferase n=1 Tax=uncultured Jatrophihabitans sp. TaxID=1610747 RepID=UPI0035CBA8DA